MLVLQVLRMTDLSKLTASVNIRLGNQQCLNVKVESISIVFVELVGSCLESA